MARKAEEKCGLPTLTEVLPVPRQAEPHRPAVLPPVAGVWPGDSVCWDGGWDVSKSSGGSCGQSGLAAQPHGDYTKRHQLASHRLSTLRVRAS